MNPPNNNDYLKFIGSMLLSLSMVFCFFSVSTFSQDLPPTSAHNQTVPSGSYVIPMDNTLQSEGTEPFNIKAYGLANNLLQNGIPLLWAIKSAKAKDGIDFTANAKRISPTAIATASVNFSGGPFIVPQAYAAQALPLINAFNSPLAAGFKIVVYETTASATVDVRYTLTHKPLIAVGLANGNHDDIHKDIYDHALIPNYIDYDDSTVNASSCVTIITSPHTETGTGAPFVANYKLFAQSGGNLLFQCHAIEAYELPAGGRYQSTSGWVKENHNDPDVLYPNADMPFTQFIGDMDGAQGGSWRDFRLTSGTLQNGTFISVTNRDYTDLHIATVSKVYNSGPGGMVFELGGHEYGAGGNDLTQLNGQRMLLNAVFAPPTRPQACGIQLGFPLVYGYKSALITTDLGPQGQANPGDTITWTVNYVNIGSVGVSNFQIADVLQAGVTLAGVPTVSFSGGATTATANGAFTGAAPNQNLLAPGAFLAPNGRITVQVPVTINLNFPAPGNLANQTNGTGTELNATVVNSDNIDANTVGTQGTFPPPPAGSVTQTQNPTIDPTTVPVSLAPTAANATLAGSVVTSKGVGISRALVSILNTGTLERSTAMTNSFGNFTFDDLAVGSFYIITVQHKRYQFLNNTFGITLQEDIKGIQFEAVEGEGLFWTDRSIENYNRRIILGEGRKP